MSFHAAYWASTVPASAHVGNAALRTLTVMGLHADDDGHAWPGLRRLCRERSCTASTIKRHLKELESAGLIGRADKPKLTAHIPEHVRPIVWRLALDYFETPQDSPDPGPQVDTPQGSQVVPGGGSDADKSVIDQETCVDSEESAAMPSEAQNDLGGLPSAPTTPTPEQIAARRYPKQCGTHQTRFNGGETFDPCSGCKSAADEWPEIRLQVSRNKRAREVEGQREDKRVRMLAARGCESCGGTGTVSGNLNCRACDPEWRNAVNSDKGLALARDAIRAAS